MRLNWLPWKYIVKKVARAEGFIDPIQLLSSMHRFAQPAEVDVPRELLRAGAVMQATGLINSRALQHNRDWIWPFWIERQFDPSSVSFVPRGFAFSLINQTHRNWTAVGIPGFQATPVVDPRGLVMPFFNSWSIDCWLLNDSGAALIPSRADHADQKLTFEEGLAVTTRFTGGRSNLDSTVRTVIEREEHVLEIIVRGRTSVPGMLVVSLRPSNPEGVSFIHDIAVGGGKRELTVNEKHAVRFDHSPARWRLSSYHEGDVYDHLDRDGDRDGISCDVGLASAAGVFQLEPDRDRTVRVTVPLGERTDDETKGGETRTAVSLWHSALDSRAEYNVPDEKNRYLFEAALSTVSLHTTRNEVWAGPFRYKRFWFRDAAFVLNALMSCGMLERGKKVLDTFPDRQRANGFFESQDGEWDSNGEVLWIMDRYCRLSGRGHVPEWMHSVKKAADWMERKRTPDDGTVHAGLMPAGYSAEHLGPSDYYYWDDFWSVAGLRSAAAMCRSAGDESSAERYEAIADDLSSCIDASLERTRERLGRTAMPASPGRRLDSGSVGSLAAGYPLMLWKERDVRLLDTVSFLLDSCMYENGFFHDIMHSGINPYLTLHIAQVLMRAGDTRFLNLVEGIARIASPTGQWPEAVHPATGGGCMGDGQHVWAASEWLLMARNRFVQEDPHSGSLVLCAGIPIESVLGEESLYFGPAPTVFGTVGITISERNGRVLVSWKTNWHGERPHIEIAFPGMERTRVSENADHAEITAEGAIA